MNGCSLHLLSFNIFPTFSLSLQRLDLGYIRELMSQIMQPYHYQHEGRLENL